MTYNTGKQLSFSYNALNLPMISSNGANGKMQFAYNAAGQKLKAVFENLWTTKTLIIISILRKAFS